VDEHNIEGSFPEFWWVGDQDRHVWIHKQHDEDTKKDGRSKEPFENLAGAGVSQKAPNEREDEHTQVMAQVAMTKFASTRG